MSWGSVTLSVVITEAVNCLGNYVNCFFFGELFYFRSTLNHCTKQSLESLSFLKVISSYAWQDSSGTPGWCAGTVPCSKRSRHFPPAAPWCSSPSLSVNGSTPSWAAIIHWRRSTNGILREASLPHLRSSAFRRLGGFLWSPLTTERFCLHPASREKLRYTSTLWLIWVNKLRFNLVSQTRHNVYVLFFIVPHK